MGRKLACFASIVVLVGLLSPLALAQPVFDFDGSPDDPNYASDPNNLPYDPTDWMTSVNWNEGGADPDTQFEPIPDLTIRVEIEEDSYGANAPVIGPGDAAQAFGVRIGRAGGDSNQGEGLLTMNGGSLEIRDGGINCQLLGGDSCSRLRVGNAQVSDPNERFPGTFELSAGTVTTDTLWIGSGSHGNMIMSGGVVNTRNHLYFDWTFDPSSAPGPDPQSSELNMTGGTINVATEFTMHRTSVLNLDGGDILVSGVARLGSELGNPGSSQGGQQTPNVTVLITDGLLEAGGFLQVGGSVTLDGGILRANRYLDADPNAAWTSVIEVNGLGLLQFNNAQESVLDVEALIVSGVITTSEASPLTVSIVDVGGTDFTQVSFATACGPGDFDCNGIVDGNDFLKWQREDGSAAGLALWEGNYGATALVAGVASVPEPSSVVLALLVSGSMVFGGRSFRGKTLGTNQFS